MLKTRVISGIVLVLIALATLITGGYVLLGVTYFLAICSFYELARACGFHGNENGTKINMIEVFGYAVITFMDAWNDYLWPLVMLTKPEMMTVPVALGMVNGQFERNFGVQMAGSLISIVPVVLIYLAAQSKMKDGLTLGGIKG